MLIEPVVSFVLPALCLCCNNPLSARRKFICGDCFKAMPLLDPDYVPTLKKEIGHCSFDDLFIPLEFETTFRTLIHLLKYQHALKIAEYFADILADTVPDRYDLITAVPLNSIRQRERGYNQSQLIAQHLSERLAIPCQGDVLLRVKDTLSQTHLNKQQRRRNVQHAFKANYRVENQKVLIIDDVITTGSTLNACAMELKKAGAALVDAAALATPVNILQQELESGTGDLHRFQ